MGWRRGGGAWARVLGVAAVLWDAGAVSVAVAAGPRPGVERGTAGDDLVFRPTVIVRRGNGQGSGTIIASVEGETLILTAAHVVRESGPVGVELHRYNLGVEQAMPRGGWPVTLPGEVAAADTAGDVAVVRVRGRPALPFVARLGAAGDEPARGAVVTSVGVDNGNRLESWSTRVRGDVWFALVTESRKGATRKGGTRFRPTARPRNDAALDPGERPFLLTARAPEHGRSGGGLFLDDRRLVLVGVCVGRVEADGENRAVGVFASGETVRRLLRENDLDTVVARSEFLAKRRRETENRKPEGIGRGPGAADARDRRPAP